MENLKTLVLGSKVQEIKANAFESARYLKEIHIPVPVTKMDIGVFAKANLVTVEVYTPNTEPQQPTRPTWETEFRGFSETKNLVGEVTESEVLR